MADDDASGRSVDAPEDRPDGKRVSPWILRTCLVIVAAAWAACGGSSPPSPSVDSLTAPADLQLVVATKCALGREPNVLEARTRSLVTATSSNGRVELALRPETTFVTRHAWPISLPPRALPPRLEPTFRAIETEEMLPWIVWSARPPAEVEVGETWSASRSGWQVEHRLSARHGTKQIVRSVMTSSAAGPELRVSPTTTVWDGDSFVSQGRFEAPLDRVPNRCGWCATNDDGPCDPGESATPADAPTVASYTGAACAERVATMRRRFEGLVHAPIDWPPLSHPTSPEASTTPVSFVRPDVAVLPEGFWRDHEEIAEMDELLERLDRAEANHGLLHPGTSFEREVNLHVGLDTSLTRVRTMLRALAAARWRVTLVVHTTDALPPSPETTPPVWLREELAASGADAREDSARVGVATELAVGACEEAASVLGSFREPAQYVELLARLPDAVDACGCGGLDVDALEDLIARRSSASRGTRAWAGLALEATDLPKPADRDVASWVERIARRR